MRRGSFQGSRATWSGEAYDAADAIDRKARNRAPDHFCSDGICCCGKLAAALSAAGGLGLIGGGYGEADWLEREFSAAKTARISCGFITWSLAKNPNLLDLALGHSAAAVMLSFGSPKPFASRIKAAGVKLICQIQWMQYAREAVSAGADIVVAKGAEAGGHGMVRATLTLVPEVADYLAKAAPKTLLVAARGIADGRGYTQEVNQQLMRPALTAPGFK